MTQLLPIILTNLAISAILFLVLWLASIALKDPSFIDSWWALGVAVLAWVNFLQLEAPSGHALILLALATAWGLRLGVYLLWRWRKHGLDRRYKKIIEDAREKRRWNFATTSLLFVFAPQLVLQFILALPVFVGQTATANALSPLATLGLFAAIFGIVFEGIADAQLAQFKSLESNAGKVMDQGLWSWSRHPNYFGELCTWWGIWLIACDAPGGIYTIVSPLLLTFLLTRVSGAPTTEPHLKTSRPEYEAYKARTSAFIPLPPKRS